MGCHLIRVEFISTDEKKRKRKVGYIARTRCNILRLGIVCFLITSNIIFSYLSQWKWEAERQCQGLFWRKFAERDEEERLLALRLHGRRPEERKGAKSQEGKRPAGKIEKRASLYWRPQEKLIPQEMENNLDQEPNSLRQCSTSAGNLGVLRTFVYSEEETIWIHDNHCDLTIKSDTSLQLLRCLLRKCLPASIIWSFLEDNPACKQEWPWLTVCHTYRETTAVSSNREAE